MTAAKKDLYIEQGATFALSFVWTDGVDADAAGDPVDLSGAVARMQFRKGQAQPALLSAASNGTSPRITLGGGDGSISILLTDADTDVLTSKTLLYDLEVEMADGTVFRLLQGRVTVDPNITQLPGDPTVDG